MLRKILSILSAVVFILYITVVTASFALAISPHENPDTQSFSRHEDPDAARVEFSALSLFSYFSDTVKLELAGNKEETLTRLEKLVYTNQPEKLRGQVNQLRENIKGISIQRKGISEDIAKLNILSGQLRAAEDIELVKNVLSDISLLNNKIDESKKNADLIGRETRVFAVEEGTPLRQTYNGLLSQLDRLRMSFGENKEDISRNLQEISRDLELVFKLLETIHASSLPSSLSFEVEPDTAYVGDEVHFNGFLTSNGIPLPERTINILFNGSSKVTLLTEKDGSFKGNLPIPYLYLPEMDIRALYYPKDMDVGRYSSSLSKAVKLRILFYSATMDMVNEGKVYRGIEKEIRGSFDYGESPALPMRNMKIYLDGNPIDEVSVEKAFVIKFMPEVEIPLGKHIIGFSAVATGRYAPVDSAAELNIYQAVPEFKIEMPGIMFIPGTMKINGIVNSELGPLQKANVNISMGKNRAKLETQSDGSFSGKLGIGMGLNLIGSQDVNIRVVPSDPWNAPVSEIRRKVFVNYVYIGIILVVMLARAAFSLRGLMRKHAANRRYKYKRLRAQAAVPSEGLTSIDNSGENSATSKELKEEYAGNTRDYIFYLYRLLLRLIQKMARTLLQPHQTLREFAGNNSKIMGPLSMYFLQLTKIIEKLLYSKQSPDEGDIHSFKKLSRQVEDGLEKRNV